MEMRTVVVLLALCSVVLSQCPGDDAFCNGHGVCGSGASCICELPWITSNCSDLGTTAVPYAISLNTDVSGDLTSCEWAFATASATSGANGYLSILITHTGGAGTLTAYLAASGTPGYNNNIAVCNTGSGDSCYLDTSCQAGDSNTWQLGFYSDNGDSQFTTRAIFKTSAVLTPALFEETAINVVEKEQARFMFSLPVPFPYAGKVLVDLDQTNFTDNDEVLISVNNVSVAGSNGDCHIADPFVMVLDSSSSNSFVLERCDLEDISDSLYMTFLAKLVQGYGVLNLRVNVSTFDNSTADLAANTAVDGVLFDQSMTYRLNVGSAERVSVNLDGVGNGLAAVRLRRDGAEECGEAFVQCGAQTGSCSATVESCAVGEGGDWYATVEQLGSRANGRFGVPYSLTVSASDDFHSTGLTSGVTVARGLPNNAFDHLHIDVGAEHVAAHASLQVVVSVIDQAEDVARFLDVSLHAPGEFTGTEGPASACYNARKRCEVLSGGVCYLEVEFCHLTAGTWYISVFSDGGAPAGFEPTYTVSATIAVPQPMALGQVIRGFAEEHFVKQYYLDLEPDEAALDLYQFSFDKEDGAGTWAAYHFDSPAGPGSQHCCLNADFHVVGDNSVTMSSPRTGRYYFGVGKGLSEPRDTPNYQHYILQVVRRYLISSSQIANLTSGVPVSHSYSPSILGPRDTIGDLLFGPMYRYTVPEGVVGVHFHLLNDGFPGGFSSFGSSSHDMELAVATSPSGIVTAFATCSADIMDRCTVFYEASPGTVLYVVGTTPSIFNDAVPSHTIRADAVLNSVRSLSMDARNVVRVEAPRNRNNFGGPPPTHYRLPFNGGKNDNVVLTLSTPPHPGTAMVYTFYFSVQGLADNDNAYTSENLDADGESLEIEIPACVISRGAVWISIVPSSNLEVWYHQDIVIEAVLRTPRVLTDGNYVTSSSNVDGASTIYSLFSFTVPAGPGRLRLHLGNVIGELVDVKVTSDTNTLAAPTDADYCDAQFQYDLTDVSNMEGVISRVESFSAPESTFYLECFNTAAGGAITGLYVPKGREDEDDYVGLQSVIVMDPATDEVLFSAYDQGDFVIPTHISTGSAVCVGGMRLDRFGTPRQVHGSSRSGGGLVPSTSGRRTVSLDVHEVHMKRDDDYSLTASVGGVKASVDITFQNDGEYVVEIAPDGSQFVGASACDSDEGTTYLIAVETNDVAYFSIAATWSANAPSVSYAVASLPYNNDERITGGETEEYVVDVSGAGANTIYRISVTGTTTGDITVTARGDAAPTLCHYESHCEATAPGMCEFDIFAPSLEGATSLFVHVTQDGGDTDYTIDITTVTPTNAPLGSATSVADIMEGRTYYFRVSGISDGVDILVEAPVNISAAYDSGTAIAMAYFNDLQFGSARLGAKTPELVFAGGSATFNFDPCTYHEEFTAGDVVYVAVRVVGPLETAYSQYIHVTPTDIAAPTIADGGTSIVNTGSVRWFKKPITGGVQTVAGLKLSNAIGGGSLTYRLASSCGTVIAVGATYAGIAPCGLSADTLYFVTSGTFTETLTVSETSPSALTSGTAVTGTIYSTGVTGKKYTLDTSGDAEDTIYYAKISLTTGSSASLKTVDPDCALYSLVTATSGSPAGLWVHRCRFPGESLLFEVSGGADTVDTVFSITVTKVSGSAGVFGSPTTISAHPTLSDSAPVFRTYTVPADAAVGDLIHFDYSGVTGSMQLFTKKSSICEFFNSVVNTDSVNTYTVGCDFWPGDVIQFIAYGSGATASMVVTVSHDAAVLLVPDTPVVTFVGSVDKARAYKVYDDQTARLELAVQGGTVGHRVGKSCSTSFVASFDSASCAGSSGPLWHHFVALAGLPRNLTLTSTDYTRADLGVAQSGTTSDIVMYTIPIPRPIPIGYELMVNVSGVECSGNQLDVIVDADGEFNCPAPLFSVSGNSNNADRIPGAGSGEAEATDIDGYDRLLVAVKANTISPEYSTIDYVIRAYLKPLSDDYEIIDLRLGDTIPADPMASDTDVRYGRLVLPVATSLAGYEIRLVRSDGRTDLYGAPTLTVTPNDPTMDYEDYYDSGRDRLVEWNADSELQLVLQEPHARVLTAGSTIRATADEHLYDSRGRFHMYNVEVPEMTLFQRAIINITGISGANDIEIDVNNHEQQNIDFEPDFGTITLAAGESYVFAFTEDNNGVPAAGPRVILIEHDGNLFDYDITYTVEDIPLTEIPMREYSSFVVKRGQHLAYYYDLPARADVDYASTSVRVTGDVSMRVTLSTEGPVYEDSNFAVSYDDGSDVTVDLSCDNDIRGKRVYVNVIVEEYDADGIITILPDVFSGTLPKMVANEWNEVLRTGYNSEVVSVDMPAWSIAHWEFHYNTFNGADNGDISAKFGQHPGGCGGAAFACSVDYEGPSNAEFDTLPSLADVTATMAVRPNVFTPAPTALTVDSPVVGKLPLEKNGITASRPYADFYTFTAPDNLANTYVVEATNGQTIIVITEEDYLEFGWCASGSASASVSIGTLVEFKAGSVFYIIVEHANPGRPYQLAVTTQNNRAHSINLDEWVTGVINTGLSSEYEYFTVSVPANTFVVPVMVSSFVDSIRIANRRSSAMSTGGACSDVDSDFLVRIQESSSNTNSLYNFSVVTYTLQTLSNGATLTGTTEATPTRGFLVETNGGAFTVTVTPQYNGNFTGAFAGWAIHEIADSTKCTEDDRFEMEHECNTDGSPCTIGKVDVASGPTSARIFEVTADVQFDYTITVSVGSSVCGAPEGGFCSGIAGSSVLQRDNYNAPGNAERVFLDLYEAVASDIAFSRPNECGYRVPPHCNETLRAFACHAVMKTCDGNGYGLEPCYEFCTDIVTYCFSGSASSTFTDMFGCAERGAPCSGAPSTPAAAVLEPDDGLSGGEIAGIVIGVTCFCCILVAIIVAVVLGKQRKNPAKVADAESGADGKAAAGAGAAGAASASPRSSQPEAAAGQPAGEADDGGAGDGGDGAAAAEGEAGASGEVDKIEEMKLE